jgi:hypothetical protein
LLGEQAMRPSEELQTIDAQIQVIKAAAEKLLAMGEDFPALERNTRRLLTSVAMLELNFSDLIAVPAEG